MDDLSSDSPFKNSRKIRYLSPQTNEMILEPGGEGVGWWYPLSDIIGGTSDATDFDEDKIICQEILGKFPDRFRERGAEHECLARNCLSD